MTRALLFASMLLPLSACAATQASDAPSLAKRAVEGRFDVAPPAVVVAPPGPLPADLAGRLQRWEAEGLYAQLRAHAAGRPRFVLHDGPPYANGAIHLGHAVNKILKDIIVKSKTVAGFDAPYIPGWDCHGLPIEIAIEKKFGKVGTKLDAVEFRQKCREYATEQIDVQRRDFKRLGVLGDRENPYRTLDFKFEADEIRALAKVVENGHLLRGVKPVYWCFDCGSALAEAEIEYQDKVSPAVDVAYSARNPQAVSRAFGSELPEGVEVAVPIWTTTPWTLPASLAISLGPDLEYVLVEGPVKADGSRRWLVLAEGLAEKALQRYGVEAFETHGRATGETMVLTAEHDGALVADVVDEWARRHGRPIDLTLTGPAGGRWRTGSGAQPVEMDAVEFCRILSGRAPGTGLLAVQIPF